ncbi:MAG TPA: hypothetical protein PKX92_08665 [Edaphocola sp.]|nr:hypothetical protein [Edaphocola sp.]
MYKASALIFFNRLFITLGIVVTTYLFAHYLPKEQYGVYQNFWTQFNTLFAISGLGIASYIFSYSPEKIIQIIKNLTPSKLLFLFGLIVLSALIFGGMQQRVGVNWIAAGCFLVLNSLSLISDSFLILFRRFKIMLLINFIYFLGFIAIHYYWLQNYSNQFELLVLMLTVLSLLKVLASIIVMKESIQIVHQEAINQQRALRLWTHLFIFDLIQIFFSYSDKFIISLIAPATTSAVYINGTYPIPFIPIIFSAVSSAALLQFNDENESKESIVKILNRSGIALSTVVFPVFFFFVFFRNEFIVFYFSDKYFESVPIFLMSLLMLPFRAFNFTILFRKKEKGKIINLGALVDIVSLLILVGPCYYFLGLKGIPLSFVVATLIQAIFYMSHHQKILESRWYQILPLKDWLKKILVFGLVAFVLNKLLIDVLQWTPFIALLVAFVVMACIAFLFLSREINLKSRLKKYH